MSKEHSLRSSVGASASFHYVRAMSTPGGRCKKSQPIQTKRKRADLYTGRLESRCSLSLLYRMLNAKEKGKNSIKKSISDAQIELLQKTPFAHFFDIPELSISPNWLYVLIKRFDEQTGVFIVGNGLELKLEKDELAAMLGLLLTGLPVELDEEGAPPKDKTYNELLGDSRDGGHRNNLEKLLKFYIGSKREKEVKAFVSVFVLVVLNTILFPLSTKEMPRFIHQYVDHVDKLGEFDWE